MSEPSVSADSTSGLTATAPGGGQTARPVEAGEVMRAAEVRQRIRAEIGKVYVGSPVTIDLLIVALLARGHVLLEGVPGIAKTTLVKTFATTLGCDFSRIQFTPDLLPADITGTYVLNLKDNTFVLRKGPLFANIVLGDEINRAPAKTQSALLEAMAENQVTIEGETLPLRQPFMVLATQNPIEQEGVYLLPEAQVDRFLFKLVLGYPSLAEERRVLMTYNQVIEAVNPVLNPADILELSEAAERIHIAPGIIDYIVRLVQRTREHIAIHLGASPRASLALMRCAKTRALIHGRTHVLPDDVRSLVPSVLNHRMILTPEAELDLVSVDEVVEECLADVPYSEEA